jgi:branched-chain amino acid aminotransferase
MAKKIKKAPIWMDGKFVEFDDAAIHPLSNSVQYGMGAFEGLRTYFAKGKTRIFRLHDHTNRLFDSVHILGISMPYSKEELNKAIVETVRKSQLPTGYIRPMVYLGWEAFGLHATNLSTHVMIATWDMGEYLPPAKKDAGLRLHTSPYARINPSSSLGKAKASGHYINSILAYRDAIDSGYNEAVMLDSQGCIAEASSSSIFIVKNGAVYTPPDVSILLSITRDTVLHICKDLKLELVLKNITRDEAYTADEMFLTGTAAEIKAIGEYDNRRIASGLRGPITKKIQDAFQKIVSGTNTKYSKWLTAV